MAEQSLRRLKIVLLVSSIACLVFGGLAAFEENIAGDWRQYQVQYRQRLLETAGTDAARAAAERMEIGMTQIFLPEFGRIDRCTTCHAGIEHPDMEGDPQPLRTHPPGLFSHHPPDKFGCTVCHAGQGRAISTAAAHGEVPYWEEPLLRGDRVYRSCGQCHYENDLYGAEDDLYARGSPHHLIDRSELSSSVPGAKAIARGKALVLEKGCLGCHQYRGRGGALGPDITYAGDKSAHDYDFSHVEGPHTVENWLYQHFLDPAGVSPGTLMAATRLTESEAFDLTEYLLSLRRKSMPAAYTPVPPRREGEPASGAQLYSMFCRSCHGPEGRGTTVRDPSTRRDVDAPRQLVVPSISHPDTLAVASDDYLRQIISKGRPGTSMIAWGDTKGGGLRAEEIDHLVEFIRSWEEPGAAAETVSSTLGDPEVGRRIYAFNCAGCHGSSGEGGIGARLASASFQGMASDLFLARTIIDGRPNTAMPAFKHFTSQEVSDVLAHIRTWHPMASDREETLRLAATDDPPSGVSARIGRILFQANCAMCHGPRGQGDLAPSLNTQEFLTLADNGYIYDAITRGRPGTAMPAWRHLRSADVASLLRFIRSWQTIPSGGPVPDDVLRGNAEAGALLFAGMCASCHGQDAEGGVGPQLNNPVFLDTVKDLMLYEWIAYGRVGTAMRPFLRGEQGPAELTRPQIIDLVSYLRTLQRRRPTTIQRLPDGRPELGAQWYAEACASCHGPRGEGASGPALSNPGFLKSASDGYILASMVLGRDGTPMRPVKPGPQSILALDSSQVNDIVAFIRTWETSPPIEGIPHRFAIPDDVERGGELYASHCAGCHGARGRAEVPEEGLSAWAPALNNSGFLSSATDGFLQATIVRGRSGTAMRPFGRGSQGLVDLSMRDVDDIVGFIRQWHVPRSATP